MKKNLLFIALFLFFSFSIFLNYHKINADFFSLLQIDNLQDENLMQNESFDNFNILVKDENIAKKIDKMADSSDLFAKNELNLSDFFGLKLALFKDIDSLKDGTFFENSAKKLFLPGANLKDDFFSMIVYPKLLNAHFDLQTGFLKTKNYYLLNYKLRKNFNQKELLVFYEKLKNQKEVYINSPQIYSSYSKNVAQKESTIFALVSLLLTAIFIYCAFSSFRVFTILSIVLFSFVCGLGMSLIILKELNFLTIVISTSLIGLIIDYAMHFLSANLGTPCQKESIKPLKNLFLTALFITTFGYALFFLSPMKFLHQIATVSIFSLVFAFLMTYYKFGDFVENITFKKTKLFKKLFNNYIFMVKNLKFNYKINLAIFVFMALFIYFYNPALLKDEVKNYANMPVKFTKDIAIFTKELDIRSDFILVDKNSSESLVKELKEQNLIENPLYLSSFLNDEATQNEIKSYFKRAKDDEGILNLYLNLGFEKEDILEQFDKIINLKVVSYSEAARVLNLELNQFLNGDKEIVRSSFFLKNGEFYSILKRYGASYVDYVGKINESLNFIKIDALLIKAVGLIVAFIALALFLTPSKAFLIVSYIIFSSVMSAFIFTIIGKNIDIFAVFGFILASAAGIDYMLFAFNTHLRVKKRIFGIVTASFTTILSFFMLSFSATAAVSNFGLSVSLNLFIILIISSILATKKSL
ncbi:hypothetical protein [uncultured Campylobacter sp.]|uniref:hypothetical protein n=1 Tax=uncultured Campylobacter sp. TaxID=218934 RepID=UPI0026155F20|nr:hypothetical protein [uncultured Campylobacter sp.]